MVIFFEVFLNLSSSLWLIIFVTLTYKKISENWVTQKYFGLKNTWLFKHKSSCNVWHRYREKREILSRLAIKSTEVDHVQKTYYRKVFTSAILKIANKYFEHKIFERISFHLWDNDARKCINTYRRLKPHST